MLPFSEDKEIETVEDFNEYAVAIFENFLEDFDMGNGLLKENTDEEENGLTCEYLYTDKGIKLAERFRDRLFHVGAAHFPHETSYIDLSTEYIQES